MLALFCLRLAVGLIGSLLLLSLAQINPRFYRTHFLTALGLTAVAAGTSWSAAGVWLALALGGSMILALLASVSWSLEGAPGGRVLIPLTALLLGAALGLSEPAGTPPARLAWLLIDDATSAAVLGTATTAMLMGHSYLIAPAMSIKPLLRLLAALAGALVLRMAVAGAGLWFWTAGPSPTNLTENPAVLWLLVRWGVGFIGPLVLGWMAWQTARIRSTQSATGILYVVVIFCFLGELTGQLLLSDTGFVL
jgi:hypothetical protein